MLTAIITAVFLGVTALDALLATLCRKDHSAAGDTLSSCLVCAAVISVFYLLSILTNDYFVTSFTSSIYFCVIDIMLLCLLQFFYCIIHRRIETDQRIRTAHTFFRVCVALDCVSLLINPFTNHAISYNHLSYLTIARFTFDVHPLYTAHLVLCYCMIAYGFGLILRKAVSVPQLYRVVYLRVILCVLTVITLNALFLLGVGTYNIDVSIITYSILGAGIYFTVFVRGTQAVLDQVNRTILSDSGQPTLIFNFDHNLFFINDAGRDLFAISDELYSVLTIETFIAMLGVQDVLTSSSEQTRFYWSSPAPKPTSYICDFHTFRDENGRVVANSFMFTNNMLGIDSLTGFQTEQYFALNDKELSEGKGTSVGIAVCDLNQLGLINNLLGYSFGDSAITLQANLLRKYLPARSIFVRMRDAKLGAICYDLSQADIKIALEHVNKELGENKDFTIHLKIDFAICMLDENVKTVSEAISKANSILKTRKLLDQESIHSNTIDSLRKMLEECDPETESHVRRTRILGDNLAFRLGLSDFERDQLSLLCLFHDIGKVGIPLNILNKPGPLNEAEWAVMREHVQKGYRIAHATAGLEIIAEPILHHHENWDGSGYPDGLQSESIPILSRIIGVVDAYDAMVSDRPYRKGMSSEAAVAELERCAGKQFDPIVADAFVQMIQEDKAGVCSIAKGPSGAAGANGAANASADGASAAAGADENEAARGSSGAEGGRGGASGATGTATGSADASAGGEAITGLHDTASASHVLSVQGILPSKMTLINPVFFTRYTLGENYRITSTDAAFETMTGYTDYDVEHLGLTQDDLLFEEDREPYWKMIQQATGTPRLAYLEHRIRCKDGTGRYVYCFGIEEVIDGKVVPTLIVTDITDSTSLQHQVGVARNRAIMSLRRLEETVRLDPMTELLNKSAFRKDCERELLKGDQICVLIMLDLDDFKHYNDTYGHPKGDELLIDFAKALRDATDEDGFAGRVGGDEFCCLLRFGLGTPVEEISERTREVWASVSERLDALAYDTHVSAGAVYSSQATADFSTLYSAADEELYRSKNSGKNRVSLAWEK